MLSKIKSIKGVSILNRSQTSKISAGNEVCYYLNPQMPIFGTIVCEGEDDAINHVS